MELGGEPSAGIIYPTVYETSVVVLAFWISGTMICFDPAFLMLSMDTQTQNIPGGYKNDRDI